MPPDDLFLLEPGRTKMVNALWLENPEDLLFSGTRGEIVLADLKGPGIIRMIHFALPSVKTLDRALLIRMYWDGETHPSVECPLVDFFLDPNGELPVVNSLAVNKHRGWNAYFSMPFRSSARIVLTWEGPTKRIPPNLWDKTPCYAYVTYQEAPKLPEPVATFHATFRQRTLLLGREPYEVFQAAGRGRFIGWHFTVRGAPPHPDDREPPVDQNQNLFIDGAEEPSLVFQGIEDACGFSWGFPEKGVDFPYTGWHPFRGKGYSAYRLFLRDPVSFETSLRMTMAFGATEDYYLQEYSKPEFPLEISSTAYWYQTEPHRKFQPMLPYHDRLPGLNSAQRQAYDARAQGYRRRGVALAVACGHPLRELEFAEEGFKYECTRGRDYVGWPGRTTHCWTDDDSVECVIHGPPKTEGMLRLYVIGPDRPRGGRRMKLVVAGKEIGRLDHVQRGRWIEIPVKMETGRLPVALQNRRKASGEVLSLPVIIQKRRKASEAVLSKIEFIPEARDGIETLDAFGPPG